VGERERKRERERETARIFIIGSATQMEQ